MQQGTAYEIGEIMARILVVALVLGLVIPSLYALNRKRANAKCLLSYILILSVVALYSIALLIFAGSSLLVGVRWSAR